MAQVKNIGEKVRADETQNERVVSPFAVFTGEDGYISPTLIKLGTIGVDLSLIHI